MGLKRNNHTEIKEIDFLNQVFTDLKNFKFMLDNRLIKYYNTIDNYDLIFLHNELTNIEDIKFYKDFIPIIIKIDTKLINNIKLYKDPKFSETSLAFYTYDNIPYNSIVEII